MAACHLAERKKRLGFNTPTAIVYTVGVISLSGGCGGLHPLLDCVISENVSLQAWVRRALAPQSLSLAGRHDLTSGSGQTLTCRPAPLCLLPPAADMTPLRHWAAMCHERTHPPQQTTRAVAWLILSINSSVRPTSYSLNTVLRNCLTAVFAASVAAGSKPTCGLSSTHGSL